MKNIGLLKAILLCAKYREKYMVLSTSGSTGEPLVMVSDETTTNVMGDITTTRSFARKKE